MKNTKESKKKTYLYGTGIFILGLIGILLLPIWNITKIQVKGNKYYTQEEILAVSNLKEGMHLLSIRKGKSIDQLEALPFMQSATIVYDFPGGLTVAIEELEKIGYVPFSGTYLSINENGQVLEEINEIKDHYPIIQGLKFHQFKLGEKLKISNEDNFLTAVSMINVLKKYNFLENVKMIDTMDINEIHLYVDKLDVIIGNMRDFDKKIEWLVQIHKNYPMGVLDLSYITQGQAILKPLT